MDTAKKRVDSAVERCFEKQDRPRPIPRVAFTEESMVSWVQKNMGDEASDGHVVKAVERYSLELLPNMHTYCILYIVYEKNLNILDVFVLGLLFQRLIH